MREEVRREIEEKNVVENALTKQKIEEYRQTNQQLTRNLQDLTDQLRDSQQSEQHLKQQLK